MSEYNNPKDEQITNNDQSITNADDTTDADLEKGVQSSEQQNADEERVPTVTPDNDNGEPGAPADQEQDSSNKGKGPSGENL